ncbi:hypothetical protein SAMN04487983_1004110 [Streptomyces sp. yr375]|uniref:hypothetical protein n=1 Tax=Streptomyces sp. yr375 TaxID=1761906 RepID=UPI0008ACEC88|nr:hypothetical protein [Streptomyces sp. yr375]SEQ30504.1 hypothetical protein SAMN04487983_1004110 [Streptomyces sp. yr375]
MSQSGSERETPASARPEETAREREARVYVEWLDHTAGCKGACRLQGIDCHHAKRLREEYRAARKAVRAQRKTS